MKKAILWIVGLTAFAAAVVFGYQLWQVRPWRVIASVNGHAITASELELRAVTLMDDTKRTQNLFVPKGREEQALKSFRRQATQMWIVKEVLLSAALAQGFEVTPADEKESLAQMTARLKTRNLTPDAFFKEGPIPEEVKRRDFREGVLINKFTGKEVRDKIDVTPKEIDDWMVQLQQAALLRAPPGTKEPPKVTRKEAIDSLRALRYREGFRKLFRDLYLKAQVACPEYPEMETLEGVSPSKPSDGMKPMPPPAVRPAAKPAEAKPAKAVPSAAPAEKPAEKPVEKPVEPAQKETK